MSVKGILVDVTDAKYLTKCNGKTCYFCTQSVTKYVPLMCVRDCTVCKEEKCELRDKPANIPVCDDHLRKLSSANIKSYGKVLIDSIVINSQGKIIVDP